MDLLPSGDVRLGIAKGYKLTMTDLDGFQALLGISTPKKHKYLVSGEYLGTPSICLFKTLHCDKLSDENNLHIFWHHFELKECDYTIGMPICYQYEKPFFINLKSSTDVLHFRLTDEFHANNVDTTVVRIN